MKSLVEFIKESKETYYLALVEPYQKEEMEALKKMCVTSKDYGRDHDNVNAFILDGKNAANAYAKFTENGIPFFEIEDRGDARWILSALFKSVYPGEDEGLTEISSQDQIKY